MPKICFSCGRVGYNLAFCLGKQRTQDEYIRETAMEEVMDTMEVLVDNEVTKEASKFGLWLHAPSRVHRPNKRNNFNLEVRNKGS